MLVSAILLQSAQELGVAAANEPLEAEDNAYMLSRFNILVDDLKADRLVINRTKRTEQNFVANQVSYTIGPDGDWDMSRPLWIARAGFVDTAANPTNPTELKIRIYTDEEWAAVKIKSLTNSIVYGIWYDEDFNEDGQGVIYPWPILNTSGKIALYCPTPLDEVTEDDDGLNTDIHVPPGWRKMIISNLAIEVADYFSIVPSTTLLRKAALSKKRVKASNSHPAVLTMPRRLRRTRNRINIITNE